MSDKAASSSFNHETIRRATGLTQQPRMLNRMRSNVASDPRVELMRDILLALVRRDGRDLTARQLSAFLIVYTNDDVQTVSSLAEMMNISRPGVTRVMDRLVRFDLMSREEDPADRRRVLARRTARGLAFHQDLATIARGAAEGRIDGLAPEEFTAQASRN